MTPEQRQTLHRILIDAKAEIKDGELYSHYGYKCAGVCVYVKFHRDGSEQIENICHELYKKSPFYNGLIVATPFDFAHPDRLALLDWMINETKP